MKLIIKAIIYRLFAIIISGIVFYIAFGEIKKATVFTVILEGGKFVSYYLFEIIYKRISSLTVKQQAKVIEP